MSISNESGTNQEPIMGYKIEVFFLMYKATKLVEPGMSLDIVFFSKALAWSLRRGQKMWAELSTGFIVWASYPVKSDSSI